MLSWRQSGRDDFVESGRKEGEVEVATQQREESWLNGCAPRTRLILSPGTIVFCCGYKAAVQFMNVLMQLDACSARVA